MRVVTSVEMNTLEAEAEASGLAYAEMMRRAGEAVARAVDTELDGTGLVVALAGPGNNGGDALVAARELHDAGLDVRVYVWKRDMDGDELVGELVRRDVPIVRSADDARHETLMDWLEIADAVVDGLLGTGLARPLEGDVAAILDAVAEAATPPDGPVVVAVDIASGLDSDSGAVDEHTVPADITVTFGLPKLGFYMFPGAEYVGDLLHDSLGIPDDEPEGRLFVSTLAQIASKLTRALLERCSWWPARFRTPAPPR
jgi:NAD(P)H-hydrate epimerase